MKTNIEMKINMQPMVMTYISSLSNYRSTVNLRQPNANNPNKIHRRVQTLASCIVKVRDRVRGSGRGGRVGRGVESGNPNSCRNYECKVIGIDGKMIIVHPSYSFEQDHWFNIPEDIRN